MSDPSTYYCAACDVVGAGERSLFEPCYHLWFWRGALTGQLRCRALQLSLAPLGCVVEWRSEVTTPERR